MKLKYYLRGLAVGVILTTIILSIANAGNKPLTDTEIRKRALELGMVESSSVKLSDVAESTAFSSEQIASSESETSESIPVASEGTSEGAGSPSMPPASVETTEVVENKESTEAAEPVTFTIKSGDSSYTVSKALASAGLVEDAVAFDNYLCDNGYSRTIRTGTYEILPGATYEEIAKKIAR